MVAVEGSALLPRERAPRSWLPVSLAVGGVVYFCVVLSATTASSRSSLLSRQEQLAGYTMSGAIDVPTHPPGMPYVKMDPMGKMAITNPDGDQLGSVNFQTAPDPIPPPPTIIRFGSVGVAPAGCPMCPVLDLEAVAAQKEKLKENQARVARLEVEDNRNMARVDNTIKSFKWLKDVMAEKLFTMKEALKASDSQLEFQMIAKENTTGAEGPGGARGWAGANGINGEKGVDGAQGPMGREGAEGPIGKEGDKGPLGITGSVGSQGVVGIRGPEGARGPQGEAGLPGATSVLLKCGNIGGQMYKGICFKSAGLESNRDAFPEGCVAWQPKKMWGEGDWWKLAQIFHTQPMTPNVDRQNFGGRCSNHEAVASFTQELGESKVWVNGKTFAFEPTGTGRTCDLRNGDSTVAVYACAV